MSQGVNVFIMKRDQEVNGRGDRGDVVTQVTWNSQLILQWFSSIYNELLFTVRNLNLCFFILIPISYDIFGWSWLPFTIFWFSGSALSTPVSLTDFQNLNSYKGQHTSHFSCKAFPSLSWAEESSFPWLVWKHRDRLCCADIRKAPCTVPKCCREGGLRRNGKKLRLRQFSYKKKNQRHSFCCS